MIKKFIIALCLILCTANISFCEDIRTDAKLYYNQGVDLYKAGQYDRSMAAFRKAIEVEPDYIDAYYNLGSILEYIGQYDAALTTFKQIIVRKPDDYESVYKAADLSIKLGQTDKAKAYLSIIPANTPAGVKAKKLANKLQTDLQTIKYQQKQAMEEDEKIPLSNAIYNNLPSPTAVTSDKNGNIYVASFSDNAIYKITSDGTQMIFLKDARLDGPIGMASDSRGNIYVSNYNKNNVIKITPLGSVSVIISNVVRPYGLYVTNNLLFVSSQGANSVIKYRLYD